MHKIQRGVSLVELMMVVAIVGILNALAWQASQQYVVRARQVMQTLADAAERLARDPVLTCADAADEAETRRCN